MRSLPFVLHHNVGDALSQTYRNTLKSHEHQPKPTYLVLVWKLRRAAFHSRRAVGRYGNLPYFPDRNYLTHNRATYLPKQQAARSRNSSVKLSGHVTRLYSIGDCIIRLNASGYYNKGREICQEWVVPTGDKFAIDRNGQQCYTSFVTTHLLQSTPRPALQCHSCHWSRCGRDNWQIQFKKGASE